jgi:hypothetical protein
MPAWSIIYDSDLQMSVTEYPIGDSSFTCASDDFTSIDISKSNNDILYVEYTEALTADLPITITCTNYRNPTVPEVIGGFSILTYDKNLDDPRDFSSDFSLDASSLSATAINDDTFSYELGVSFPSELTEYALTFETPNQIDSDKGCYVKYTFPDEIDISSIDKTNIQGSGMFVDDGGAIHTFTPS